MSSDAVIDQRSLTVRDICAWHEANGRKTDIFWGVGFSVESGQILGIVGPNGSGKTTLIRAIAGLHPTVTGQIVLPRSAEEPRVTMIPQAFRESFFPWASLETNIRIAASSQSRSESVRTRAARIKTDLGIDLDLALRPPQCSGGMLQQAALLRALVPQPDLLIADEPFSALDVNVGARLRESFRRLVVRDQIVAVLVEHDLATIVDICDRVLVIPGKPYSSYELGGHQQIAILDNRVIRRHDHGSKETRPDELSSFVEMMQRILDQPRGEQAPVE